MSLNSFCDASYVLWINTATLKLNWYIVCSEVSAHSSVIEVNSVPSIWYSSTLSTSTVSVSLQKYQCLIISHELWFFHGSEYSDYGILGCTSCSLVRGYRHILGTCCLRHHFTSISIRHSLIRINIWEVNKNVKIRTCFLTLSYQCFFFSSAPQKCKE
jgi:hypothetical protein